MPGLAAEEGAGAALVAPGPFVALGGAGGAVPPQPASTMHAAEIELSQTGALHLRNIQLFCSNARLRVYNAPDTLTCQQSHSQQNHSLG